MRMYLSSLTIAILRHLHRLYPNRKINVLRSFALMEKKEHQFYDGSLSNINSLMFDCGAYTKVNAKSGNYAHVNLSNYIKYLKTHKQHYEFYANYDEDFTSHGFKKNLQNLEKMRSIGLNPFPVVHDYFMRELNYYLNNEFAFIALGGVRVPGLNGQQRTEDHIKHAMKMIPTDKVRTHLFGSSSYKLLAKYPFFSCDSSSWAQNNMYGFVLFWNWAIKNKEDKTEKLFFMDKNSDYFRKDRNYWETYGGKTEFGKRESFINKLGFTYWDLMGKRSYHYRALLNAIYYLTLEDVITELWSNVNRKVA